MMTSCPAFEVLSRFSDGALEAPEERAVVEHLGSCEGCRKALGEIEEVDALLTLALPGRPSRFRLLRPASIPLAAAVLLGIAVGWFALSPAPGASPGVDSPLAVADQSPSPGALPLEPAKDVICLDRFTSPELSPLWKTTESVPVSSALVDAHGRRALSLVTHPGGKKRWALVSTSGDFAVGEGVSVDVDFRIPRPARGGRMQVLLHSRGSKAGRSVLRWSWTPEEELLETQTDGRGHPVVLWSSKSDVSDSEWHRIRMTVTPRDVVLQRDGVESARRPHGLDLERATLTVGGTGDRKGRELHEPFECQVGGVVVRRESAQ
jgi:hypothetical protein